MIKEAGNKNEENQQEQASDSSDYNSIGILIIVISFFTLILILLNIIPWGHKLSDFIVITNFIALISLSSFSKDKLNNLIRFLALIFFIPAVMSVYNIWNFDFDYSKNIVKFNYKTSIQKGYELLAEIPSDGKAHFFTVPKTSNLKICLTGNDVNYLGRSTNIPQSVYIPLPRGRHFFAQSSGWKNECSDYPLTVKEGSEIQAYLDYPKQDMIAKIKEWPNPVIYYKSTN